MHFQKTDSIVLMIGERKNELGGSVYYSLYNELGAHIPKPNLDEVKNQIFAITDCVDKGLILSCHDISDGGMATAVSEMTINGGIGCKVNMDTALSPAKALFSETGGFIVETSQENVTEVQSVFSDHGLDALEIGVTGGELVNINESVNVLVSEVKEAWTNGLRDKL